MIILKNGLVVDPATSFCEISDVAIVGEVVKELGKDLEIGLLEEKYGEKAEVIDCTGCIVGPGLVDVHVHFRDPGFEYKEDIESGAKAAARGGVTSVILMANTKPVVDNEDTLSYVLDKGAKTDIHVYSCASITKGLKGAELVDMEGLLAAGAAGFTDDGIPILSSDMVHKAMEESARLKTVLSFHEEDPAYISNNGVNNGSASEYFGIGGSNRKAEITMIERDIKIAQETGAIVNFQHVSTKEAVELIRAAKKGPNGENIHAEATPHHISMTEEDVKVYGTCAKMNPPLRTEEDRQAIILGIVDNTLDLIATDHAPHAAFEKEKDITEAPSGIIGIETSLSTSYNALVRAKKMDILQLFCKMSYNPSKLYKIDAGELAIDRTADIVVFDPNRTYIFEKSLSKSFNSPLKNREIIGDVVTTISSGKVIYKNM